ncbi:MAG: CHASE2 domain-containing protein [Candidatus Latescibacterota bacterium]
MARLASRSGLMWLAAALIIAYTAALAAGLLGLVSPVRSLEQETLDWRFLLRGPASSPAPDVVLVTVDEDAGLPYWSPVPRQYLAQLVDALAGAGARLVALDFALDRPVGQPQADALLRASIERAGNVVLASYLEPDAAGRLQEHRAIPHLQEASLDWGYATFFSARGVEAVREGAVAAEVEGRHALSLAGTLYARMRGLDTGQLRRLPWSQRDARLPEAGADYRQPIDYRGPPLRYYRSLGLDAPGGLVCLRSHELLALPAQVAARLVAGRVVLVGSGLKDAPDQYRTPYFARRFGYVRAQGVEIHGQLLAGMLAEDRLRRAGLFAAGVFALLPAFAAALVALRLRPYWSVPIGGALVLGAWGVGHYAFVAHRLILPLVGPSLSTGLACLLALAYLGSTDGRRWLQLRERFAAAVGEGQLRQLLDQPEAWGADGETRVVSAVWAAMPPLAAAETSRDTIGLYQVCWQHLSRVVHKHAGAVVHYESDGLGAVFGAPIPAKDHAVRAALAAVDLAEAWLALAAERQLRGRLAIGVDTGRACLGELAGGDRSAYRAVGEPVDRARRLAVGQCGTGEVRLTQAVAALVGEVVSLGEGGQQEGLPYVRVTGRLRAPPIGAASQPPNPLWKYMGLARGTDSAVSVDLLGRLPLFADLRRGDLRQLVPLLHRRRYAPQETVFAQGEVGSAMYLIERGSVDILRRTDEAASSTRLVQRLVAGEFFGELALLSDVRRTAAAVAYEPSDLLVLFQSDLYDLIERKPELGVRLIRSLSRVVGERLVRANEEVERRSEGRDPGVRQP